jgi:uncharacterized protein YciI
MSIFAVEYTYRDLPDVRAAALADHRTYLGSLARDGHLLGSGPYTDGSPGALLVFRAEARAPLDALLAADPFVAAGLLAGTRVRAWDLIIGAWADGV